MRRVLLLLFFAACKREEPAVESSPLHTIELPAESPVNLPEGEGKTEVIAACTQCHTPRYIENQPKLSRKAWQTTVDKMRTVYGAPIVSEASPKIVNYLVATHGTE